MPMILFPSACVPLSSFAASVIAISWPSSIVGFAGKVRHIRSQAPCCNEILQELAGDSSGGCCGDPTPEAASGRVDDGHCVVSESASISCAFLFAAVLCLLDSSLSSPPIVMSDFSPLVCLWLMAIEYRAI